MASSTTPLLSSPRVAPAGALASTGVSLHGIPGRVEQLRSYFATHVTKSYEWRKKQLQGLRALLLENESVLVAALRSDLHKPVVEGGGPEVLIPAVECQRAINLLSSWMEPEYVPTPFALVPASSYIHREPYGVVLLIAPFNYPVQLIVLPLIAALSAGNCVVVKPSELTPSVSATMAELLPRYIDPSALCVVQGGIPESTALLRQRWDFIFFTGSETIGKIVAKAAAEHLTPCVLELGGKSPVIVDRTADIPLAARRLTWGKLINAGQSCVAPDYVFIHSSVKARFVSELQRCIDKFYGRDPQLSPDFGRIVSVRHTERLKHIIDAHRSDIVIGGEVDLDTKYVAPTILDLHERADGKVMEEEVFGPVLPLIDFTDIGTAIAYINRRPKALAMYLFSDDSAVRQRVLNETSSGGFCINDVAVQLVNKDLPFGGVGSSGVGSYHGRNGFLQLSHSKAVLHKSTYFDVPVRYPPYTDKNYRLYRIIVSIIRISQPTLQGVGRALLTALVLMLLAERIALFAGLKAWW